MKNINVRPFAFFMSGLFVVCFIGVACVTGSDVRDFWSMLIIAYKTVPVLLAIWMGFVSYAWKWSIFRGWLVPFPCLDGTWQGNIQTTWRNPDAGESLDPIPVLLTVRQTFGRISCVMRTSEATSHSYCADFWIYNDEQVRKLAYCYTTKPSLRISDRNQPHDGSILFEIIGEPPRKLKGSYWTTRKTTGEITLMLKCHERLDDLPEDFNSHPMEDK